MPFTPLHMGPGLAVKALAGRHFSLLTFGIAQVAMDIEPLVGMLRGSAVLHGATHTYLAALIIGGGVALLAPALCRPILNRWNRDMTNQGWAWLAEPPCFGRIPILLGAFGGTLSHVFLDSIMHFDITPLAPWSNANSLRGVISIDVLELGCLVAGLCGSLAWVASQWLKGRGADGKD